VPQRPAETTDLLAQIVSVWREVLAPTHVGPDSDFFDCGGNSLNAARIVARLVRDTRRPVKVRTLFENPSPVRLAAALGDANGTSAWHHSVVAEPGDSALLPLTSQQEAIWFTECLNPAARSHSSVTTVRLPKPLEPGRLQSALQHVVGRNEALRTSASVVGGKPVQVLSETAEADLRLRGRTGPDELAAELRELSETPFDMTSPPLIFWVLYEDAATGGAVLAQVEHHFLHEAWSARLILEQIAQAYRDEAAGQEGPGYRSFAEWQRRWLDGADAARQRDYWATLLAGDRGVARFPNDERRPHVFSHRGATIRAPLAPHLAEGLSTATAALTATPFSVMFAAFGILIGAEARTSTLVVGTAYRNRQPPFERTVGLFANTLGIPVPQWAGRTFRDVVSDTSALLASGHDNQAIPLAAVARELRLRPQLSRNPLFQVCLSMSDCPGCCLDFGDCEADGTDSISGGAKLDLDVVIVPSNGRHPWHMLWRYYTEILTAAEVTGLSARYEAVLSFLAGHPDLTLPEDLLVPSHRGRTEAHV
jgi:hypothetical protein